MFGPTGVSCYGAISYPGVVRVQSSQSFACAALAVRLMQAEPKRKGGAAALTT